jgi:hypothetical protein
MGAMKFALCIAGVAVFASGCDCRMPEMTISEVVVEDPEQCLRATVKRPTSDPSRCEPAVVVIRNACPYPLGGFVHLPAGASYEFGAGAACPGSCRVTIAFTVENRQISATVGGSFRDAGIEGGPAPDAGTEP